MTPPEWQGFLQRWSNDWLATQEPFPADVRERRWLGFPPATEKEVAHAERRLGFVLPPSYRSFLLATNGWRRTTVFIEGIRPVSKIDWLQRDNPELLNAWYWDDDGPLAGFPPEEYFSYDGRPMYDEEHLRGSIVVADPIRGDSMIYLLNPRVVAADGEWEAWRFAHWIPGAERFPSFELLMRAEYESFSSEGHSQSFFGPYVGIYAPDQPRHAAIPISPGRTSVGDGPSL